MTRQVLYCAHPLRPTEAEIADARRFVPDGSTPEELKFALARPLRANLDRAMRWLDWLRRSFPETTFIAPWIAGILAGEDDADPAQREAGLVDACAVIERCDGIVLCGGRISSGMRREMEHGKARGPGFPLGDAFGVYDLTKFLIAPPHPEAPAAARGRSFRDWYELPVVG